MSLLLLNEITIKKNKILKLSINTAVIKIAKQHSNGLFQKRGANFPLSATIGHLHINFHINSNKKKISPIEEVKLIAAKAMVISRNVLFSPILLLIKYKC